MRLELEGCHVDIKRRIVDRDGDQERLTTREADILRYLAERPGVDVTVEDLLRDVWGFQGRLPQSRAPIYAIARLRKKVEIDPAHPRHILTVHGAGYRFVPREGATEEAPPELASPVVPVGRDAFVGRRRELVQLVDDVLSKRLVCIVGPGGVGKTRLATEGVGLVRSRFDDQVLFCDLGAARNRDGVLAVVAATLHVDRTEADPTLADALRTLGRVLVVLDNVEQVVVAVADLVDTWLDGVPDARFLVTTRAVLAVPGEHVHPLAPLAPADSRALFLSRAEAAHPGLTLDDAEARDLATLLAELDHLPLAIELAAARVRLMPPSALLARIGDRFKLLSSVRGRVARHASLRASIAWSFELLPPLERRTLAQLSVFAGGFDLAAMQGVVEVGDAWHVDLLQALIDKSLVRAVDGRFTLLTSIQAFAREHVDDAEALERRHGAWFAATEVGEADLHNVRVACRRAVARGDHAIAVATCERACRLLASRGPATLGVELVSSVLALPLDPAERRRAEACRDGFGARG